MPGVLFAMKITVLTPWRYTASVFAWTRSDCTDPKSTIWHVYTNKDGELVPNNLQRTYTVPAEAFADYDTYIQRNYPCTYLL